jgi:GGDEF domain-containing protein
MPTLCNPKNSPDLDNLLFIQKLPTDLPPPLRGKIRQSEVDAIRLEFRPGEFARVGISVGMASFPEDGDSLEVLLQKADQAMYQNKHSRARAPENVRRILTLVQTAADQKAG